MKRVFLLASLAALGACGKPNDIKTLHHEAEVVTQYYRPRLDSLDKRVQNIFKRGTTIPANLPGIEEVGKKLTEARDSIAQLRGIVGQTDKDSPVIKQADQAAKDRKIDDLEKLVFDTEKTMEEGTTVVQDDLYSVESWIALYDQGINRAEGEMPMPPPPPPPDQTQPVQPPPAGTAPTGAAPAAPAPAGSPPPAPAHP
jgi:hypothetical protein